MVFYSMIKFIPANLKELKEILKKITNLYKYSIQISSKVVFNYLLNIVNSKRMTLSGFRTIRMFQKMLQKNKLFIVKYMVVLIYKNDNKY